MLKIQSLCAIHRMFLFPIMSNDLLTIDYNKGYWINMIEDATITITGQPISDTSIPLFAGWNLVGYKGQAVKSIDESISSINNEFLSIWSYDSSWKRYIKDVPGNNLEMIKPEKGYWINVKSGCIWTLPY